MRGILLALAVVACLGVAGCSTTAKPVVGDLWRVVEQEDRFDDTHTKMVTIGEEGSRLWGGGIWTVSMHYYPFVGIRDGEILFGIRSGGRFKMPVGAVQVRIDGNKAWTISPKETPVYLAPNQATMTMPTPQIEGMQKNMEEMMAKNMSPFTATTGDKAKTILKEMFDGHHMIYRTVGYNQSASTEGEVLIDESFAKAMRQIGITKEMLK